MLNNDRKLFVTASQAYNVMAGYEIELSAKNMTTPCFKSHEAISKIFIETGKIPKVGDMKCLGVTATGAEIKESCAYVKAQNIPFSRGMMTAALNIAMSAFIMHPDESIKTRFMVRGNNNELEAISELEHLTGIKFSGTGDDQQFFSSGPVGVTPDCYKMDDSFNIIELAEVKCPKDTTHMRYLYRINDQKSLLAEEPKYYWQCQCGLAVTGADHYHWMSYHNGFAESFKRLYVKVYRNNEHIELLKKRSKKVLEKANDIVESINIRFND